MKYTWIVGLLMLSFFTGCLDDDDESIDFGDPQQQLQRDIEIIDNFLEANNIDAQEHSSGLRFIIRDPGGGVSPNSSSAVTVNFEGRLLSDGGVFDQADSVTFELQNLIEGWQIGVPLIKEGGSITLYIPSSLGFGPSGITGIPPNSNLIFDIDLLEVK